MKRVHVIVRGIVQGVGFRYTARGRAVALGVSGWVRNRPDGSVEAEIEGDHASVEALLEWMRQGPPGADVTSVGVSGRPSAGDAEFEWGPTARRPRPPDAQETAMGRSEQRRRGTEEDSTG